MPPLATTLQPPEISHVPPPPVSIPPTWRGVALVDAEVDCTPESPAVVGFELREILGEGGMGTVYRGLQEYPQRVVALKVLKSRAANSDAFRRFKREVDVLARLQHPGIPHLFSAGTLESPGGKIPYIAMELVQGQTIDAYCDARKLGPKERVDLFLRVCDAVSAVHRSGILHRDLSPHNILVNDLGQPKVLDFGLACFTHENSHLQTMVTTQGRPFGTIGYMSPEQASGRTQEVDARSDVYSLGVILYKLLTGTIAVEVEGLELFDAVERIHTVEPIPLGKRNRAFRGDLEIIVAKALSKQNRLRYQNVSEFAEDLRRCQSHLPIAARPPSLPYRAAKFLKRHTTAIAVTATVGCLLAAGSLMTWQEAAKARTAQHDVALEQAYGSMAQGNASLAKMDFATARTSYNRAWDLLDQEQSDALPARLGLWEVDQHATPTLRVVEPTSKFVERVSISANDSCLALLKTEGHVTIRDVVTNQIIGQFQTKQTVRDMQFSPDGRHLVILGDANTESWNSRLGVLEHQWQHPLGNLPLLKVSNNFVIAAANHEIVRNPFNGSSQTTHWFVPGDDVRAIGVTAQDELLAVDSDWHLRCCQPTGAFVISGDVPHPNVESPVHFSPDGKTLVVVDAREASVYAIAGLEHLSTIAGIDGHANGGFAGEHSLVFSRDAREPDVLYDISGEPQSELPHLPLPAVAFTHDLALVGEENGAVRLLLTRSHPGLHLLGGEHSATAAALDPEGNWAAYSTIDDHVRLCDAGTGDVVRDIDCSASLQGMPIRWILFGARGADVVVASTQQVVFLDRRSGSVQARFALANPISGLSFARTAETPVAVGRFSKSLMLWRRTGDQWIMTETPLPHLERGADMSADGSEVLLGGSDSGVELWRTEPSVGLNRDFPELDTPKALLDATGNQIISFGALGQIALTPSDGSTPSSLLTQANSTLTGITPFGQHGLVFASGGMLSFFDLRDHRQIYSLPLPNQSAQFLSASADGDRLLVWGRKPGPAVLLDFELERDLKRPPKSITEDLAWFSRLGIRAVSASEPDRSGDPVK